MTSATVLRVVHAGGRLRVRAAEFEAAETSAAFEAELGRRMSVARPDVRIYGRHGSAVTPQGNRMSAATLIPVRPSAVPPEPEVTAEQLVQLNGIGRQARKAELVDGRLVRKTMSFDAKQVAGRSAGVPDRYLRQEPVGALLLQEEND